MLKHIRSLKKTSEQLQTPGMDSKVRVVVAVTTLLLGPLDVGSSIIGKEGVLEMILVMANSGEFLMQVRNLFRYSFFYLRVRTYFC